jgi:uncharacterized SAM-binding protein YcdF (DUF218 family)
MRGVVVALLALAAATAAALAFGGRLLVVADPLPVRADAIVMLAGSIPDRVLETAELYRSGVAPRVVVTRERSRPGDAALRARGVRLPEPDEMSITALERLGVPADAIVRLRRRTHSTESEAATIARWACTTRIRRLIVVTSRAHTRRSRLIFTRMLGSRMEVTLRPSRFDSFSARRWWRVRRDAKTVLYEWERLVHYWLDERWTIRPCGGLRPARGHAPLA